MKNVNDAVKWICGMGLVLIALLILAEFTIDYNHAEQQLKTVTAAK